MENTRLKIPYPILVEGKYDRLRILSVAEADVYTTDGFGIFRSEEKKQLLRTLAAKTKIIVLADSDGAGKVIRSHISSLIPKDRLIPLYVPQIPGKEKRKAVPSKEGFLGVEGMERALLTDLLVPYANGSATACAEEAKQSIKKTDLYADRLTGAESSGARRDALARKIGLPCGMTSNALLAALNVLYSYEEYRALIGEAFGAQEAEKTEETSK